MLEMQCMISVVLIDILGWGSSGGSSSGSQGGEQLNVILKLPGRSAGM